MTGSGKTGLGVVLIEELAGPAFPVIAIDPKGDLTNLALTFADSPRSTSGRRSTKHRRARGHVPDEFAAGQADLRAKGLGGRGRRRRTSPTSEPARRHDPHTGFAGGCPGEHGRRTAATGSRRARRSRGLTRSQARHRAAQAARGQRRSARDPGAHLASTRSRRHGPRVASAVDLTPLVVQLVDPAVRESRRVPTRPVLPRRGSDRTRVAAQRAARHPRSGRGAGHPLDVDSMLFRRDGRPRHPHDGPSVRRGQRQFVRRWCCRRSSRGCAGLSRGRASCARWSSSTRSPGTSRRRRCRPRRGRS